MGNNRRSVYSTESGSACKVCGWPSKKCQCSKQFDDAIPSKVVAKLRIEKSGRKGKTVTVIYDLPRNKAFLKGLAKELKAACGSGGKAGETTVEIQGEHREKLRTLLQKKGWTVKG